MVAGEGIHGESEGWSVEAVSLLAELGNCEKGEIGRMRDPFPIYKGKPMPPRGAYRGKYPWRRMEVGDSFLVPCDTWEARETWDKLTRCRWWATYKTGFRFALRRVHEGIAVWRTW